MIYHALTHAWSAEEGMTEVDSPYTEADCEVWEAKEDHPPITDQALTDLREGNIVPNERIRVLYERASYGARQTQRVNDGHPGSVSESAPLIENIKEAYHLISGQNLHYRSICDKVRVSLGIGPKGAQTAIFVERQFAEAVVKALSIEPREVGL